MVRNSKSMLYLILILFSTLCSDQKTSNPLSRSFFPDTTTFFPLIPGSVWYYEEYLEGELQKDNALKDSVSGIIKTDTSIIVEINRISIGGRNKVFSYIVTKQGKVLYQRKKESKKKPFCNLFPLPGDSIGEMTYSAFNDTTKTKITLQTSEFDKASSQEQLEWQCRVFEKGIGIVSFGGASLGYELIKYRIGTTKPVITYRKEKGKQ